MPVTLTPPRTPAGKIRPISSALDGHASRPGIQGPLRCTIGASSLPHGSRNSVAGWPRVVASPGLPQIRTCPIRAYGSSGHGFATR